MAKTHKATIKKAHKIARAISTTKSGSNRYAIGMAQAKRSAAKRKAARKGR